MHPKPQKSAADDRDGSNEQSFQRQTVSLVVRLWQEPFQHEKNQWRGQIELVESGEKNHFHTATGLIEVVAKLVPGFAEDGQDETMAPKEAKS